MANFTRDPRGRLFGQVSGFLGKRLILGKAGKWILIGSSLRDRTITSTLDDVLRTKLKGALPKIAFLDRGAEQIIERLRQQGLTTLANVMTPITKDFPTQDSIDEIDRVFGG